MVRHFCVPFFAGLLARSHTLPKQFALVALMPPDFAGNFAGVKPNKQTGAANK